MAVSNDIYASTQRVIKPKKVPSTSPCGHLAKAMKKINSKKKGT